MIGPALTDAAVGHGLGDSRRAVLEELRAAGTALDVHEISERTGLHPNTARFHLGGLIDAGLVKRQAEERSQPGRPRVMYQAVAVDTPTGPRSYRLLAEMLAGLVADAVPNAAAAAVSVGQAWGRFLAPRPAQLGSLDADQAVRRLSAVLDSIGFAPGRASHEAPSAAPAQRQPHSTPSDRRLVIPLRHCPFREIAAQRQEVVCSLHLGLMQGVLAELRAPLDTHRLDPFVRPSLCLAHLAPAAEQSGQGLTVAR